MVRGLAATSCLHADPDQDPKVRYLAKGAVPDHGEERVSTGHRDYDYLEWIARLTSHIPDQGTQLVHYYDAYSNAHRGIALRREAFIEVPPENEPSDPPRPDSPWLAARRKSWARLIRRVYEVDPFPVVAASGCVSSGSSPIHPSSEKSLTTSGGASNR